MNAKRRCGFSLTHPFQPCQPCQFEASKPRGIDKCDTKRVSGDFEASGEG